ncbi:MAG: dTDP-4-dehydrorhamnose reductase [Candidatus Polarisedimenticolaceae bacterium]|nr:dTDP-4-dehydrorhamnose reductase [Candidatus Polarisedimenticolaceae bacterium]
MRIMLTGANGQVGWELARSLMPLGEVIALNRQQCDLSHPETIPDIVKEIKPDVIVNAAAYTAVDKAEEEESLATLINGLAVGVLAEEAKKRGALLIHFSTDYIFDGTKSSPYNEEDTPSPINAYGRSKLAGEVAIKGVGVDHVILRTTWVYSERGQNFVNTILHLASERDELNIVSDQYGAPTWSRNIADATAHIICQLQQERALKQMVSGTYNLCSSGHVDWYGFARLIIEKANECGVLEKSKCALLHPCATEAYPLPAKRPQNSRLDCSKFRSCFGLVMPSWQSALSSCITALK